jgi:hypothetical protein
MFGKPFHHKILRKMVIIFGNLFNNIYVVREQKDGTKREYVKVPILYAPKEKYLTRLENDPILEKPVQIAVPRMSFEMTSIAYDSSRKQQGLIKHSDRATHTHPKTQYMGVPYTFNFNLYILAKNIEDGAMIVEQILPYFQPDYTVTATFVEDLEIKKDIPIILDSIQEHVDYEGAMATQGPRSVTWDLGFTVKGWMFGPVANTAIIMGTNTANSGVITNIYQGLTSNTLLANIITVQDPLSAGPEDDYGYSTTLTEYPDTL